MLCRTAAAATRVQQQRGAATNQLLAPLYCSMPTSDQGFVRCHRKSGLPGRAAFLRGRATRGETPGKPHRGVHTDRCRAGVLLILEGPFMQIVWVLDFLNIDLKPL